MTVMTSAFSLSRNPLKRFEQRNDYLSLWGFFCVVVFFKDDLGWKIDRDKGRNREMSEDL